MKIKFLKFFSLLFILFACKEPEARRPITQKTTTIYKEIVNKNKAINNAENKKIALLIKKDSLKTYINSNNGFWYTYVKKDTTNLPRPKIGDVVEFTYDIKNLYGQPIYTQEELGVKNYKIDKEDFIPALQEGLKLMKAGEIITFLIPSYKAYGIIGDGNKIGINQSLISTIHLLTIKTNLENEN